MSMHLEIIVIIGVKFARRKINVLIKKLYVCDNEEHTVEIAEKYINVNVSI